MRRFAARYRHDVVGIVLIDATPRPSFDRIPGARETSAQKAQRHRQEWLRAFEDGMGLSRALGRCSPEPCAALMAYRAYLLAQACRPAYDLTWLGEFDAFEMSAREVVSTKFGSLPLLVISQDPDRPKPGWTESEIAANAVWAAMQEQSKSLATRSQRIIARASGHRAE